MNVITRRRLIEYAERFPDAGAALKAWCMVAERADWRNLQDVRRDIPSTDGVIVKSQRIVTVFNIRGNKYRLITAIHYNKRRVFVLRLLTHAEYDKNKWKQQL